MLILKTLLLILAAVGLYFNVSMVLTFIWFIIKKRGRDNVHFDYTGGQDLLGDEILFEMEVGGFAIAAIATLLAVLSIYVHAVLVVNFAVTTVLALVTTRGIRHQRLCPISHRFHL